MTLQLFKGLVALMVMVCIPWLLESFRNLRKTDYRHSEDYLRERVQQIYGNVVLFYNRLHSLRQTGELAPTEWPDFDALYCSEAWCRLVAAVSAADEERPEGEKGFFSWSYWTCAQDFSFMYVSDVLPIDKTGDRATVSLVVHNGDLVVPVLLCMVYERDDWRIDDIICNWNRHALMPYFDWKEEMTAACGLNDK